MKKKLVILLLKIVDYLTNEHKEKLRENVDSNTLVIEGEVFSKNQKFIVKNSSTDFYLTITGQRKGYTIDFDLTEFDAQRLIGHLNQQIIMNRRRR